MSTISLKEGFRIIEGEKDSFFKAEISEEIILQAQNLLGVIFPESYRLFLSTLPLLFTDCCTVAAPR